MALLDWLTDHCDILETGNESWRFKHRAPPRTPPAACSSGSQARPVRTVRAALDIHCEAADMARDGQHLEMVHIGIASGRVIAGGTGSDTHREFTVTGDSVTRHRMAK